MYSKKIAIVVVLVIALCLATITEARTLKKQLRRNEKPKQIFDTRETNAPNFIRLLLMRIVYGIAAQMGAEERVAGLFNGAFAPPNADDDYFDLDLESDEIEDVMGFSFF